MPTIAARRVKHLIPPADGILNIFHVSRPLLGFTPPTLAQQAHSDGENKPENSAFSPGFLDKITMVLTVRQNCCRHRKRYEHHDPHRRAVSLISIARQDLHQAGRIAIQVITRVEMNHLPKRIWIRSPKRTRGMKAEVTTSSYDV